MNQVESQIDVKKEIVLIGGLHSTEVAFLLLTQRPWVRFSAFPKIHFAVSEIYQWHKLKESVQRFQNGD